MFAVLTQPAPVFPLADVPDWSNTNGIVSVALPRVFNTDALHMDSAACCHAASLTQLKEDVTVSSLTVGCGFDFLLQILYPSVIIRLQTGLFLNEPQRFFTEHQ